MSKVVVKTQNNNSMNIMSINGVILMLISSSVRRLPIPGPDYMSPFVTGAFR